MGVEELPGSDDRRSLVGRLVTGSRAHEGPARATGRVNPGALLAGGLALGAFAISLSAEWVITTVDLSSGVIDSEQTNTLTMHASAGTIDSLGQVYILGGIALLGLVGAAISRPDLAARVRLPLLGIVGGLLAVLVALTIQLPSGQTAGQLGASYYLPIELRSRISAEIQPGLYFAYAAVVLPLVAVLLAAKPLTRTQVEGPVGDGDEPEPAIGNDWVPVRAEGATGLTVSAADPHDHHSGTDVWRSS